MFNNYTMCPDVRSNVESNSLGERIVKAILRPIFYQIDIFYIKYHFITEHVARRVLIFTAIKETHFFLAFLKCSMI